MKLFATALVLAAASCSSPVMASTILEIDPRIQDFSDSVSAPTDLGSGVDRVIGTGQAGETDVFLLREVTAPSLEFTVGVAHDSQARPNKCRTGGSVRYALRNEGSSDQWFDVANSYRIDGKDIDRNFSINLPEGWRGDVVFSLKFRNWEDAEYELALSQPSAMRPPLMGMAPPTPAAVPVPAPQLLLASGILAILGVGYRRQP